MKYDLILEIEGHGFRFKDIEAANQEDAEIKCKQQLKRSIKLASIQPSPAIRSEPRESNARPISDDAVKRMMDMLGFKK